MTQAQDLAAAGNFGTPGDYYEATGKQYPPLTPEGISGGELVDSEGRYYINGVSSGSTYFVLDAERIRIAEQRGIPTIKTNSGLTIADISTPGVHGGISSNTLFPDQAETGIEKFYSFAIPSVIKAGFGYGLFETISASGLIPSSGVSTPGGESAVSLSPPDNFDLMGNVSSINPETPTVFETDNFDLMGGNDVISPDNFDLMGNVNVSDVIAPDNFDLMGHLPDATTAGNVVSPLLKGVESLATKLLGAGISAKLFGGVGTPPFVPVVYRNPIGNTVNPYGQTTPPSYYQAGTASLKTIAITIIVIGLILVFAAGFAYTRR